jgi:hypothetical protein
MPAASKMGVTASLVPTHTARIGFGRIRLLRCACAVSAIARAAACADASAVGTFITRMASFSASAISASSAAV